MKKFIYVIVLVVLLVGFGLFEALTMKAYINESKNETYEILAAIVKNEPKEDINAKIKTLEMNWDKRENILCVLVNHKDLDNLKRELEILKNSVKYDRKEEALQNVKVILFYLDIYPNFIGANLKNIF